MTGQQQQQQQQVQSRGLNGIMILRVILFLSVVGSYNHCVVHAQTCHGVHKFHPAPDCKVITVPEGLCTSCPLGQIDEEGFYIDCKRSFDTESEPCLGKLREYVDMNPCDAPRREALETYTDDPDNSDTSRQILDYFIYSLCGLGCDCIPRQEADPNVPSVELRRGNCQGHAQADVCRLYPNATLVRKEGTMDDSEDLPKVCPLLDEWSALPDSQSFISKNIVSLDDDVRYFLTRVNEAVDILELAVYQDCFRLESLQKRVIAAQNTLVSGFSSMCMETHDQGVIPKTRISQYKCNPWKLRQEIIFDQLADEYYEIKLRFNGLCIASEPNLGETSRYLNQQLCDFGELQQWKFLPHAETGKMQVQNRLSGLCIFSESTEASHLLRQMGCDETSPMTAWSTIADVDVFVVVDPDAQQDPSAVPEEQYYYYNAH